MRPLQLPEVLGTSIPPGGTYRGHTFIVWFRNDLRLADNPALVAGPVPGHPVVPVYVLDEETEGTRLPGAAARWWLHHSLQSLDAFLHGLGSR